VAFSTAVLAHIAGEAWETGDRTQIGLVLWIFIGASAATYVHLPPKLLVPSAPAMALVVARQLDFAGGLKRPLWVVGLPSVLCVVLGVLIIRADSAFAEVGRIGGRVVAESIRAHQKVWMDGAWGFQWYAMAAGAEPMAETSPRPRPGDVVVAGPHARLIEGYRCKTLLWRRLFAMPGGRVLGDGAGFYTNLAGPWPWVWGDGEIGRIEVWRIDSMPALSE
jgi:hypothetical protein